MALDLFQVYIATLICEGTLFARSGSEFVGNFAFFGGRDLSLPSPLIEAILELALSAKSSQRRL